MKKVFNKRYVYVMFAFIILALLVLHLILLKKRQKHMK